MKSQGTARLVILSLYVVALTIGIGGTYIWLDERFFSAPNASDTAKQSFLIERGWSLKTICSALESQGFVRSWWATWFLARVKGNKLVENNRSKIKPGEYELSHSMTPSQILQKFINEEIVYHDLLIPEGSTVAEIAEKMVQTTLVTREEALAAMSDQALMSKKGIPQSILEGYLFPAKYSFTRPDNAEYMVTKMIDELNSRFTREMVVRAGELGLSKSDILILASIVEKETGNPEERPLIASVFHNRLRLGMRLQSDPTVIYGIPNFNGNLTRNDLETPSRYNTYINVGLPPTPICSPGLDSIMAALYPTDTDYLYFVARGDGTSEYSANYKDHQEAVRKFQKAKKAAPAAIPDIVFDK